MMVAMGIAADVLAIALAVLVVGSALATLTRHPTVVDNLTRAEVPTDWFPVLAAVQVVGAAGLVYGVVADDWVGLAAAYGFVAYFLVAVLAHVRADDRRGLALPLGLAVVSFVTALLHLA
jgi:hypothetical protein